jgi:hypothetical protein
MHCDLLAVHRAEEAHVNPEAGEALSPEKMNLSLPDPLCTPNPKPRC